MKFTRRDRGWQLTFRIGFGWAISLGRHRKGHYFLDILIPRRVAP